MWLSNNLLPHCTVQVKCAGCRRRWLVFNQNTVWLTCERTKTECVCFRMHSRNHLVLVTKHNLRLRISHFFRKTQWWRERSKTSVSARIHKITVYTRNASIVCVQSSFCHAEVVYAGFSLFCRRTPRSCFVVHMEHMFGIHLTHADAFDRCGCVACMHADQIHFAFDFMLLNFTVVYNFGTKVSIYNLKWRYPSYFM